MHQARPRIERPRPTGSLLSDPHGSLSQLLDRLFWLGLLPSYVPRREPRAGSEDRICGRRLLDFDLAAVRANQRMGVRYAPLSAIAGPDPFGRPFATGEQVVLDLFRSGIVLAAPPPPAWAVAALARGPEPEIAWLARPPLPVAQMGGVDRW